MSVELKTYLGDSVYCEYEPCSGQFWLTTNNGYEDSNRIAMEPEVLWALDIFRKRIRDIEDNALEEQQERQRSDAQANAIIERFRDHQGPRRKKAMILSTLSKLENKAPWVSQTIVIVLLVSLALVGTVTVLICNNGDQQ